MGSIEGSEGEETRGVSEKEVDEERGVSERSTLEGVAAVALERREVDVEDICESVDMNKGERVSEDSVEVKEAIE